MHARTKHACIYEGPKLMKNYSSGCHGYTNKSTSKDYMCNDLGPPLSDIVMSTLGGEVNKPSFIKGVERSLKGKA